jgi:hypothetical protein
MSAILLKTDISCVMKVLLQVGVFFVSFGISLSGYAVLNALRTAENNFDAK